MVSAERQRLVSAKHCSGAVFWRRHLPVVHVCYSMQCRRKAWSLMLVPLSGPCLALAMKARLPLVLSLSQCAAFGCSSSSAIGAVLYNLLASLRASHVSGSGKALSYRRLDPFAAQCFAIQYDTPPIATKSQTRDMRSSAYHTEIRHRYRELAIHRVLFLSLSDLSLEIYSKLSKDCSIFLKNQC